jgi:hypothetical protein
MALILRIDVDRPYGKTGVLRHIASRISSDLFLPRIEWLRYLAELKSILRILNQKDKSAYLFFRKCTLPSPIVCELLEQGGHVAGLHLENSRSFETFQEECHFLQEYLQMRVRALSKHGSGKARFGRKHYAPYEPEKYLAWAKQADMRVFFGNGEDPTLRPIQDDTLCYFPSAFWLEPDWRDTKRFPLEWLLNEALKRDVVMLLHPDNVLTSQDVMNEFLTAIDHLETKFVHT